MHVLRRILEASQPSVVVLDGKHRKALEPAPAHTQDERVARLEDLGEPPEGVWSVECEVANYQKQHAIKERGVKRCQVNDGIRDNLQEAHMFLVCQDLWEGGRRIALIPHLCLFNLSFMSPIFSSFCPRPPNRRGVQGSKNWTSSQGTPNSYQ